MNERTTGIYRSYEGWVVLWSALVESNDEGALFAWRYWLLYGQMRYTDVSGLISVALKDLLR